MRDMFRYWTLSEEPVLIAAVITNDNNDKSKSNSEVGRYFLQVPVPVVGFVPSSPGAGYHWNSNSTPEVEVKVEVEDVVEV